MSDESSRLPVDQSAPLDPGHLLPPPPEGHRLLVLDPSAPGAIETAVDGLVNGRVVAFPTDTVYALAASLAYPPALERVVAIKGRPKEKPLPVLLASASYLEQVALDAPPRVVALLARYWPGPLTVVVPAREGMPEATVAADRTIGVRVPNHPLALEVVQRAGGAVAATSANRSGEPSARDADQVRAALGDEPDMLLAGGAAPGGIASTVIGFAGDELVVLREGAIPGEHLRAAWRETLEGEAGA
jgi:L-threonylcarbamoyladenylate synthase